MVAIYNTSLSATSQRHFSDGLGGVKFDELINDDEIDDTSSMSMDD